MRWVWIALALAGFIVCGLLGLTAGITLNPASTIRFIPNWGSLGDWVSGIGALSAVIVTLWLAEKQRREDSELLQIKASFSYPFGPGFVGTPFISLNLTSKGKRPVTVTGLSVTSVHSKMLMAVTEMASHSPVRKFPIRLDYGQQATLHLVPGTDRQITEFVQNYCDGNRDGLRFVAITTTGYWEESLHKNLLDITRDVGGE